MTESEIGLYLRFYIHILIPRVFFVSPKFTPRITSETLLYNFNYIPFCLFCLHAYSIAHVRITFVRALSECHNVLSYIHTYIHIYIHILSVFTLVTFSRDNNINPISYLLYSCIMHCKFNYFSESSERSYGIHTNDKSICILAENR